MKKVFTILAIVMYWSERIQPEGFHRLKKRKSLEQMTQMHKEEMEHWEKMDSMTGNVHGKHPMAHAATSLGKQSCKPSNLSTNWLIVDLGFTNYNDKTNYARSNSAGICTGQ